MPTTRQGTVFTSTDFVAVGSSDNSRLTTPDALVGANGIPLLFYFHGAGGNHTEFTNGSNFRTVREVLLDAGFALLEANAGGGSWGNAASRVEYQRTFVDARSRISIGPVVCLGRSMGGITSQYAATQDPVISPHVTGLLLNSAVCSLQWQYENIPSHVGLIEAAYSFVGPANFAAATAGHDPLRDYGASTFAGLDVSLIGGSIDTVVPFANNGEPMQAKIGKFAAATRVEILAGQGHTYPSTYETPEQTLDLAETSVSGLQLDGIRPVRLSQVLFASAGQLRSVNQVIHRTGGVQRVVSRHGV